MTNEFIVTVSRPRYVVTSERTIVLPSATDGDVNGPATATDHALVRYDSGTGKLIQDSTVILDDAGNITGATIDDYTNTIHADALHFRVKATELIARGQPLAVTGYNVGESALEVALADNTTGVGNGLAEVDMANGAFGMMMQSGHLENLDTSSWTEGDILYVNGSGVLTDTEPTTGFAQPIAFVLRSHATTGALQVNADYPKQDASDVRVTPAGNIVATTVQTALEELDTEKEAGTLTDQLFTPTGGQTVFTLSAVPLSNARVFMFVNNATYIAGNDFTISGPNITWLEAFTIEPTDIITIRYPI
ncbi:MAG: hypothetical protein KAT71_08105 [Gammaproteobacteria bacterium]|nr:hypothetical protein [Gammaproteobacteria bacterium]